MSYVRAILGGCRDNGKSRKSYAVPPEKNWAQGQATREAARAVVDFAVENHVGTLVAGDPGGVDERGTSSTCPRCLNDELPTCVP
jgi:hypothetical protein